MGQNMCKLSRYFLQTTLFSSNYYCAYRGYLSAQEIQLLCSLLSNIFLLQENVYFSLEDGSMKLKYYGGFALNYFIQTVTANLLSEFSAAKSNGCLPIFTPQKLPDKSTLDFSVSEEASQLAQADRRVANHAVISSTF